MRYIPILLFVFNSIGSLAQDYCIDGRFAENEFFDSSEIEVQYDISYGLAEHWYNDVVDSTMNMFNIAFPEMSIDPLPLRPLMVMVHGGGFFAGDKLHTEEYMKEFARAGYVCASPNYRVGWAPNGSPEDCNGEPETLNEAIYKACQDLRAFIRYITFHAEEYGIDTAQMFIGGISAGGMTVLSSIFGSQEDFDLIDPALSIDLNELDSSTNSITVDFSIRGLIGLWSSLVDTNMISNDENIPVLLFYGKNDSIVPPVSGPIYGCDDYMFVYGAKTISERLENTGICFHLHTNPSGEHTAYMPDYTIPNIACFVKGLLCGSCVQSFYKNHVADCSVFTSVSNLPSERNISPNPASDQIQIKFEKPLTGDVVFDLFDHNGRNHLIRVFTSDNSANLDVSGLVEGIYILRVRLENEIFVRRFSIVR